MRFMDNPYDSKISDLFEEHAEELDQFGLGKVPVRVPHEGYDGFIPFTNGGWRCMVMDTLDSVWGSGRTFAPEPQDAISKAIDYSLDMALEEFINSNYDALRGLYDIDADDDDEAKESLKAVVSYHDLYDKDEGTLAEELSEEEHSSLSEGGEFWVEFRAHYYEAENMRNETGEDEICFIAGVNTDFQYGRDKGLDVTFERTITVADMAKIDLAELVKEMHDSVLNEE